MSRFTTQLAAGLLLAPALLAASVAQAHQAGDIIVRAGAVTVDPRESSSRASGTWRLDTAACSALSS